MRELKEVAQGSRPISKLIVVRKAFSLTTMAQAKALLVHRLADGSQLYFNSMELAVAFLIMLAEQLAKHVNRHKISEQTADEQAESENDVPPISRELMLILKPRQAHTTLLPRHTNIADMTANDKPYKHSFSPASSIASSVEATIEKFDISRDCGTSPLEDILIEKLNQVLTGQALILDCVCCKDVHYTNLLLDEQSKEILLGTARAACQPVNKSLKSFMMRRLKSMKSNMIVMQARIEVKA